jgi:hypothetical protein
MRAFSGRSKVRRHVEIFRQRCEGLASGGVDRTMRLRDPAQMAETTPLDIDDGIAGDRFCVSGRRCRGAWDPGRFVL